MQACNAHLSSVFALYSDTDRQVEKTLASGRANTPEVSFTDHAGMTHRVWPVTDRQVLEKVRKLMQDKAIFIADGHHRYETALNYRNTMRTRLGSVNPRATFEHIMMYLTDMTEEGLTILPTHRLLRNLGALDPAAFIRRAESFFEIQKFNTTNGGELKWKATIEAGGTRKEITVGFYCKEADCVYVLTARRDAVSAWLEQKGLPAPVRALDVVVLDQVILRHLLDLSDAVLSDEHNISFTHDFSAALTEVKSGRFEAGFFINHTRIEQVRDVASAGLIMPHKSTYFYPKVISGLIINPLVHGEEII